MYFYIAFGNIPNYYTVIFCVLKTIFKIYDSGIIIQQLFLQDFFKIQKNQKYFVDSSQKLTGIILRTI